MKALAQRWSAWGLFCLALILLVAPAEARPTHKAHAAVKPIHASKSVRTVKPGRASKKVVARETRATRGSKGRAVRAERTERVAVRGKHGRAARAEARSSAVTTTRLIRGRHGRLIRVRTSVIAAPVMHAERFYASSFADQQTVGDVIAGEDPVVRLAAIEALGNMNGTVLAIDPSNGRILAMVNQKLALSSGAEPCSTIKLSVALAALEEGLIKRDTQVSLSGGYSVNLTYALAKSVNPYFETLGRALGFERVKHYANQFGLGELAGYNIPGEQLGRYPDTELPQSMGRGRPDVLVWRKCKHDAAAVGRAGFRNCKRRDTLLPPASDDAGRSCRVSAENQAHS